MIFIFTLLLSSSSHAFAADGAYLTKIAGCTDCHTASNDRPFAGGLSLDTPFGTFYTPNITPDDDTGIGKWSLEQFRQAVRHGIAPDGGRYYPVFPYRSYAKITDEDSEAIYNYLRTLEPIRQVNRPQGVGFPFNQRIALRGWQLFFLGTWFGSAQKNIKASDQPFAPDPARSPAWNRGAYLAEAMAHCAECHTPRNSLTGALDTSEWMAGSTAPVNGLNVPNITRNPIGGLGTWTRDDWETFLSSGRTPSGDYPSAEMAQVINNTSSLEAADRSALVEYLMSLPAVERGANAP